MKTTKFDDFDEDKIAEIAKVLPSENDEKKQDDFIKPSIEAPAPKKQEQVKIEKSKPSRHLRIPLRPNQVEILSKQALFLEQKKGKRVSITSLVISLIEKQIKKGMNTDE